MRSGRSTGVERSRATEFSADGVTKYYDDLAKATAAAAKYQALAAIGGTRFRSPVVRSVSDDPPRIEFEILPAARTADAAVVAALRDHDEPDARAIVAAVGTALAGIHDDLDLPTAQERSRAPALRDALPPGGLSRFAPSTLVTLHGDFGFSNVWLADDGVPVIFDPEPSRYTSNAIDAVDFPEMDLATYVTCLAGRAARLSDARLLRRHASELIPAFLSAYREARADSAGACDGERLACLVRAQVRAYRRIATWRSGLGVALAARRAAAISGRG
ncbi:MAG: hypothetical protein R8F63_13520 [Acidimicrobiales bacterium]|nr:hypothetical protein [Acidimicrobiales bacterium]